MLFILLLYTRKFQRRVIATLCLQKPLSGKLLPPKILKIAIYFFFKQGSNEVSHDPDMKFRIQIFHIQFIGENAVFSVARRLLCGMGSKNPAAGLQLVSRHGK